MCKGRVELVLQEVAAPGANGDTPAGDLHVVPVVVKGIVILWTERNEHLSSTNHQRNPR